MCPPPAHKIRPAANGYAPEDGPKDFYSSPAMAKLCGFTLYENLETSEVFVATEMVDPGQPPMCRQPDCLLVAVGAYARLLKGTTAEFRAGGVSFPAPIPLKRAAGAKQGE